MAIYNNQQPPTCFGKHWDQKDAKCMGGYDPTYTGNPSHIRSACVFQASCSIRTQTVQRVQEPIPPSQLVRPALPAATTAGWQPRQWQPPQPPSSYAPPQQIQSHTPYAMPQFLPVREPLTTPRGKRFVVETLRAIGMAFGHTIANFFGSEHFTGGGPPTNTGQ